MQIAAVSGATGCSRAPASQPLQRTRAEWPGERLDQLRALFDAGLSHLLIAGRMGVAKGVISAKLARLGWRRGETLEAQVPVRSPPPLAPEPARVRRLEDLGEDDCHWPLGEDGRGVRLFCGCARAASGAYCEGHRARSVRRPRAWERKAMEPRAPERREDTGWDRFRATEGPAREEW
ncbi:MAG: GcrA-like regulator [Caulobacter sp.]|nr:GcrA-like regulator [Caulobacter sp.]